MALVTDGAEAAGLEQGFGFALMNLAWGPAAVAGSAAGGAVAEATDDAVPYLAGAAVCLLSLAVVTRRPRLARG